MPRHAINAVLLLLLFTHSVAAQEQPIWSIGSFDGISAEFDQNLATVGRTFVVNKSQPAQWAGSQQAVIPQKASEATSAKIVFELADAPRGIYKLKLGLIYKTARAPVVQVVVNNHKGWFHQRLESNYREGNDEGVILPQYAIGTLTAEIPAEFLRRGENEIALTALTDPLSTALPGGEVTDNAVLTYDALALTADSGAKTTDGVLNAEATPTVFYRREGGQLAEVVSVLVRWNNLGAQSATNQNSVTLTLPDFSRTLTLADDRDFGEQRVEFSVPEFAAGTKATIKVLINNASKTFTQNLTPRRKWTIQMVPHEHLDIGYSDFQTKLAETHSRIIDDAMTLGAEHPEFSFSLDGYWQAKQFLDGRTEAEKQKFYRAVKSKNVIVPAQHSVMLTGFPTAEALLRSFYPSHKLNRAAGGAWNYANATDVPSYSWSYASILAASGIKYFAAAANADRGPVLMLGDLHRKSPFWWEGPDGARVLMWYARHYHQVGSEFGLPTQIATGYEGLASYLAVYERPDYKSNHVLLYGSQWENTSLYPQQAALAKAWNRLYAYPQLRFSGFADAMENIAADSKDTLPVIRGDGGPYWEDGIASDAYYAALERETERRAASAEKLGTIASLVDTRFQPSREALDTMWENIALMNEHTWGWGRSVTEPHSEDSTRELAYKRHYGKTAHERMEYLLDRSMTAIAGQIETPSRALVIFNTLNWARSGWVEFDLQQTRDLVNLETGETVKFEVLQDFPAYQRIRFMAKDVPAVGYRTYAMRDKTASTGVKLTGVNELNNPVGAQSGSTQSANTDSQSQSGTLENSFYRITLDSQSGAVRSIYDKQLARELVDSSSPYRLNQYVYVTGGDDFPNQLLTYRKAAPHAKLTTHAATEGKLISVTKTSDGIVARLESRGVSTPLISTEIILFDREKKIAFNNRINKDIVYKKEAAYFAFPLAMRDPQFSYEVQNGIVDPAKNMVPGANLEWFSSHNWAAVSDETAAVSVINLDSFLWTFGDIVRGTYPTQFGKRGGTIFSYAINNYWNTNYVAAQGGEFTFRYVLTSSTNVNSAAVSRMGWEETTPLERILIKSQDQTFPSKKSLPAAKMSFLQVDNPNVVLSAWKKSEDGEGTVLRFIEQAGAGGKVAVTSTLLKSTSARSCNAMEECSQQLRGRTGGFDFTVTPRQIFTTKIVTQ